MQRFNRASGGRRRSILKDVVVPTVGGAAIIVALTVGLEGCSGSAAAETAPATPVVTLVPEDIATVDRRELATGPIISGTLVARRHATVRAEVGGSVTAVYADRGTVVAAGAPLLRIDARSIADAWRAATIDVRTDEDALALARRRLTRSEALLAGGAISAEALEDSRQAVSSAEAKLAASQSRLAAATDAMAHTTVRAPFAGVVSARPVNTGDIIESGNVLFEVLDPTTMHVEASVPSAQISVVRVGSPVELTVTGYPGRTFTGRVERVNPAADAATRQVTVFIAIQNGDGNLVAGLFAEGRVVPSAGPALLVPEAAIERANGATAVVRLAGGRIERRAVVTGRLDADGSLIEIRSGLTLGDTVVIGVSRSLPTGMVAQIAAGKSRTPAAATPTAR